MLSEVETSIIMSRSVLYKPSVPRSFDYALRASLRMTNVAQDAPQQISNKTTKQRNHETTKQLNNETTKQPIYEEDIL